MRRFFLLAMLVSFAFTEVNGQHDHSSHQAKPTAASPAVNRNVVPTRTDELSTLLTTYYNLKNALVADDPTSAAISAGDFLKIVNSIDYKLISEGNIHILAKDAGRIETSSDIDAQRKHFAALSSNMAEVARTLKLVSQPIYLQYCPMKKASWLSSEKEIRNPYYGGEMLTCGEVTKTF